MLVENIKQFINTADFDTVFYWISNADLYTLLNPYILIPIFIIFALIAYPKTSHLGQQLILYVPAGVYLFVTVIVLKNDSISEIGPFIMAMILFFMIIGWLIWTRLLND